MFIKRHLVIILCVLIALLLFFGREEDRLKKAQYLSLTVYYPFISVVKNIEGYFNLQKVNYELNKQVISQNFLIGKLRDALYYNNNSSAPPANDSTAFVVADVVGYTGPFKERNMLINKGRWNGIHSDLAVVNKNGVVGKVILVSQNFSEILPINHPRFRVAALNLRSRVQGIVEASETGDLFLSMVELGSDISVGDTIVTSNISTVFPKGMFLGKIKKISASSKDVYAKAELEPFVNLRDLEQVAIILPLKKDSLYEKANEY